MKLAVFVSILIGAQIGWRSTCIMRGGDARLRKSLVSRTLPGDRKAWLSLRNRNQVLGRLTEFTVIEPFAS